MRIVAALVVAFLGAAMLVADAALEGFGSLDDFGPLVLILGLVALAAELYVLPLLSRRRDED